MNTSPMKKGLLVGVIVASLILGYSALKNATPSKKEERIFKEIRPYSPYVLEKRVGGLEIVDKRTGTKEKPSSREVLLRLDEVESKWGKEHLRIEGNELIIFGENNQSVARLYIQNEKERKFLKDFYGI